MAAATELAFPASPLGVFGGIGAGAAAPFLLDADTQLRIVSVNSVAGVVVGVQGLRIDPTGTPQPIQETHTPASNRTTTTQDFNIGAGALLRLTLFVKQGSPLMGQTYVLAQLIKGIGTSRVVLGTLAAGLITAVQAIGFPGSPIRSSLEVEPVLRNIVGTHPAAGTAISETCPAGARWELVGIFCQLTTDANPGNRAVFVETILGGNSGVTTLGPISSDQGSSSTFGYSFAQNLVFGNTNGFVQFPIAQPTLMLAGDRFLISALGLFGGDQFTSPNYQVRERLEVN